MALGQRGVEQGSQPPLCGSQPGGLCGPGGLRPGCPLALLPPDPGYEPAGGFGDFSVARHEDSPFPEACDGHRGAAAAAAGAGGGGTGSSKLGRRTEPGVRPAASLPARSLGSLWLLQMPTFPLLIL